MTGVSDLADSTWYQITGGADQSDPTVMDVQYQIDKTLAYMALKDWDAKYKDHMQHDPDGNLLVPFPNLPLTDRGKYEKFMKLPGKPMNLPRGKGLLASYGDPADTLPIFTLQEYLSFGSDSFFLKWRGPAYGVWAADELAVYDRCRTKRTGLEKLNLFLAIPSTTNITPDLEYVVKSEVIKHFLGAPIRADRLDTDNNAH